MLILGYKQLRRGAEWYEKEWENVQRLQGWLKTELSEFISQFSVISFDNLALEQLNIRQLLTDEEWEEFYMGSDGDFTFYMDLVAGTFSKNSVAPENERYPLMDSVDDMFNFIHNK